MTYVLMREGVYQQGIFGVFESRSQAVRAGESAMAREHDAYHTFYVYELPLNYLQDVRDGAMVATISKNPHGEIIVSEPD